MAEADMNPTRQRWVGNDFLLQVLESAGLKTDNPVEVLEAWYQAGLDYQKKVLTRENPHSNPHTTLAQRHVEDAISRLERAQRGEE